MMRSTRYLVATCLWLILPGCREEPAPTDAGEAAPTPITNRIAVDPEVVQNLGLTFATAGFGRLEVRIAVPGQLELPETRSHLVRAPAAGRVSLHATRWQDVAQGDLLLELRTPQLETWLEALSEARARGLEATSELLLVEAEQGPLAELARTQASALAAARDRIGAAATVWQRAQEQESAAAERFRRLEQLSRETTVTEGELMAARGDLVGASQSALEAAETLDATRLRASELALEEASARARVQNLDRRRQMAADALAAAQAAEERQATLLAEMTGSTRETAPDLAALHRVDRLPVRAPTAGTVVELLVSDGEWVEAGAPLLRLIDPTALRFVGHVPEEEVGRLEPGATVMVSPAGAAGPRPATLVARLPVADPVTRTVPIMVPVDNADRALAAGVSATAWVQVEEGAFEEVLVPERCLVQVGLEWICFRRDPADSNVVIRTPVSLGRRSAGMVEVLAGVGQGEELVAAGIHQLKELGVGTSSVKGHFHADGTFHTGDG